MSEAIISGMVQPKICDHYIFWAYGLASYIIILHCRVVITLGNLASFPSYSCLVYNIDQCTYIVRDMYIAHKNYYKKYFNNLTKSRDAAAKKNIIIQEE